MSDAGCCVIFAFSLVYAAVKLSCTFRVWCVPAVVDIVVLVGFKYALVESLHR